MEPIQLTIEGCRARQRRVADALAAANFDVAVLATAENVQYLTATRPHWLLHSLVMVDATGHTTLVCPNSIPDHVAADEILTYEAQWHSTLRQTQPAAAAMMLRDAVGPLSGKVAVEAELPVATLESLGLADLHHTGDVQPIMRQLRRCKDADELALIGRSIECTHAMYQTARQILEVGVNELEMYSQLQRTAVQLAGEPLTASGNDYQCNSPGGPPRNRTAGDGELYILDLGAAYRGYWADNCRTFAVNGSATDPQQAAWEAVVAALRHVEATVKPGKSCGELFNEVQAMLDGHRRGAFFHHLGHGFGLFPHETPHLNPNWDDTFQEGDVFTAEPGLYYDELRAGIRLEENYRVTARGVEKLTRFPLEL